MRIARTHCHIFDIGRAETEHKSVCDGCKELSAAQRRANGGSGSGETGHVSPDSKTKANIESLTPFFRNFVWRTRNEEEGRTRLPAAMAAGVTDRLMTFEQLFDAVMGGGYAMAAQYSYR
jgi:hypothetical protein